MATSIISMTLTINNEDYNVTGRPSDTLLHIIRHELGLTGAKPGCLNGDCGACTVIVDDVPIKSCLMLAVEAVGHKMTTIEGLKGSPIQEAFIDKWGFQCGYCTSGFIMNCHALLTTQPNATREEVQNWLQSNICRCTSYQEIDEAVHSVLQQLKQSSIDLENEGNGV